MIGAILAAALSAAGPPDVFGVVVGRPMALPECNREEFVPAATCWSTDPGDARGVQVWLSSEAERHAGFAREPIWAEERDGVVIKLTIRTTGVDSQDDAAQALMAKFGKPTSHAFDRLQNRMGAKFIGVRATWLRRDLVVKFDSTADDLDDGEINVMTPAQAAREIQEARASKPSL